MQRREFITLLGSAAAAWPLAARAQQPDRMRRIGMLMGMVESDPEGQRWVQAFIQALQELGWRSGTNVRIDLRWATDLDHMRTFAKELVELRPDLIQVTTTPATAEVLRQTHTIPVVFSVVSDPVGSGFVQNLPRPGGNATGFTNIESTMGGKWVELLKEIAPRTVRVALLFNPTTALPIQFYMPSIQAAALSFAIQASTAPVHDKDEIDGVIAALARDPGGGLIVAPNLFNLTNRDLIIALAARYGVPAISVDRAYAEADGLISYGSDITVSMRQAAGYIDRILKGARPADLPVQNPTRFELVINLKTAKALGLDVPPTLLAIADEVIE
jgi:putative tryptophan/tyrosine transport system substrate-binding protein